jgi:hypothetical protein
MGKRKTIKHYKINQRVKTTKRKRKIYKGGGPEELISPKLEKELIKNFQFINELIDKGKDTTINYNPTIKVSDIITIYFHEKYKQECPMYPITIHNFFDRPEYLERIKLIPKIEQEDIKEYSMKYRKRSVIGWNKDKFLKNLKLCLDKNINIILVPVHDIYHTNMLIIKAKTREIIRFEPHGKEQKNISKDEELNIFLTNLTNDINVYLNLLDNSQFRYIPPTEICPKDIKTNSRFVHGFQALEGFKAKKPEEGLGFCQLWSWFFAECIINNPEMDVKDVYKESYRALLNKNMDNFAWVIRGYFISINEELVKMQNFYSIDSRYMNKTDTNVLIEYLNKSRENLETKPLEEFKGGKYKNKFVLPIAKIF